MSKTKNTVCKVCGKDIYVRPVDLKQTGNFCSRKCFGESKRRGLSTCPVCGNEYKKKRREQRFCSLKCFGSQRHIDKWNGKSKSIKILLMTEFYRKGWDGKCMHSSCDYGDIVEMHRIIFGKNDGEYMLDNVCFLCPNHHAEIHYLGKCVKKVS